MNPIARFLHFWAGVDSDLLAWCPQHERRKYVSIGTLVLLTGTFAFMSAGYAFFTVFDSVAVGIVLGTLWAFVIINVDRLLLMTFPKTLGWFRQMLHASMRLVLATFIGITIAHPLAVRLFQAEIQDKIAEQAKTDRRITDSNRQNARQFAEHEASSTKQELPEFGELQRRQAKRESLSANLTECEKQAVLDQKAYVCEADGTCGTRVPGCRAECERKRGIYLKTEERCQSVRQELNTADSSLKDPEQRLVSAAKGIDARLNDSLIQIDKEYRDAIAKLERGKKDSFFARSEAMATLGGSAQTKVRFVTLALILLEAIVVLVKVMTPQDSADKLAAAIGKAFAEDRIRDLAGPLAGAGIPVQPVRRSVYSELAVNTGRPAESEEKGTPERITEGATEPVRANWSRNGILLYVAITMLVTGGVAVRRSLGDAVETGTLFVAVITFVHAAKQSRR